ncbi:MAG: Cysteine desulfurase NifS [Candidatus Wolfebacteria bacterium GW2011_GWC1_43_10]|uniref:cysteine desulfurase n=1 Tax=Candidatus Wolfebacteria bacterium GW2011_GWC1_43_10 TaxID=1619011 RepID=A0A0G1CC69_9BACT|nr:MAG: Cysteine desulfurase NifS [Candidatus Wolfebacteria bacterium GW2011_GWC1_43_10]KKT23076.1 MAG: Cysteine desulfurase [Parcubacteria group bacterium GW2011_GWB1_43_8b]
MESIYLDYASTTPVDPRVLEAMMPCLEKDRGGFGNPNSLHFFGQKALVILDEARTKIAKTVFANYRDIVFTSSATEANNLVIRGSVKSYFRNRKTCSAIPKIIISSAEHPSVMETVRDLAGDGAVKAVFLPVDKKGVVDLDFFKKELDENTILVSVMWVNNETGSVQPISDIAKIISDFRTNHQPPTANYYPLFHTDAAQAPCFFDLNVLKSGVDLMTLSSHKIYGPKGSACLYLSNKLPTTNCQLLSPIITGGGQEYGLRSGTENIPAIAGFGLAAETAASERETEFGRTKKLSLYFFEKIKEKLPLVEINGDLENRSPHILNLFVPYKENLVVALDLAGVAASSGSACSQRIAKSSHVLSAMGFNEERIKQSVRFSFGKFTTKEEIDTAIERIIMAIKK